ncbi:MAG: exodeoxyribonuclease V subunit gamma [Thermodesulfobacteriota bacterium]
MAFKLFVSNRMEVLAGKLAETLLPALSSPLVPEYVVVQSQGMERWLRLELARRHGVSANINFPFPNAFLFYLFHLVVPGLPDRSAYEPEVLTWRIMDLLGGLGEKPGFDRLGPYLAPEAGDLKRLQLSDRIADVFDQYLVFRPEMIEAWEKGKEDHWQARLWRELTRDRSEPHRAALFQTFLRAVEEGHPGLAGLPERVSIFGLSALPRLHMAAFAALARRTTVNLFLMNPCREYWGDILTDRAIERIRDRAGETGEGDLHLAKGNSLLASLGTLGRDFFDLVLEFEGEEEQDFQEPEGNSVLARLQSDILNLRPAGAGGPPDPGDGSIQVHSCHSPLREVEVLYDRLLSMFENDPALTPRDVIVMTPDIEEYAPYIQAVFGQPEDEDLRLPYSIADRSARRESRLIETWLSLLDLAGDRFPASAVLDLLDSPDLRRRFDLTEEDLPLVQQWVLETRVRWGLDAAHRARLNLPATELNTWRAGLDRLALGYALPGGEERTFCGVLPYDDVEGADSEVLGRFLHFAQALDDMAAAGRESRTLADWASVLAGFLDRLFLADETTAAEAQLLRGVLGDMAEIEALTGFSRPLALKAVRWLLGRRLERRGFGFGFLTGGVTFCAMLPMRAIPFPVVCLLGLEADAYPRQSQSVGFDLIAHQPRRGDRSRRDDDRYLFLEALLSARKTLYISYVGQSLRDNSFLPPSVLVSELLDYLASRTDPPQDPELLVTRHRLQALSPAYFHGNSSLFSYSAENLAAARALAGPRQAPPLLFPERLPPPEEEYRTMNLDDLLGFFAQPVQYLLTRRLGLRLVRPEETPGDTEPFDLSALEKYELDQFLAHQALAGRDLDRLGLAVKASGRLPHGGLGDLMYNELNRAATDFAARTAPLLGGEPGRMMEIDLSLGEFHLTGRAGPVYPGGLVHFRHARLKAKDFLRLWLHHLALGDAVPESRLAGLEQAGGGRVWTTRSFRPVGNAGELLGKLLALYWEGLSRPLPFFPRTSFEYAQRLKKGEAIESALDVARLTFFGTEWSPDSGEGDNYYRLCFRDDPPLDEEFHRLSLEVFGPLLENMTEVGG